MPILGILGGFETLQNQFFHIFGAREKIGFFLENRFLTEKSAIFLRFFYFRFFLPKIVSNLTENRFFAEKSAEKNDFFCPWIRLCNEELLKSEEASEKSLFFFSLSHFLSFSFTFSLAKHPLRMITQRIRQGNLW